MSLLTGIWPDPMVHVEPYGWYRVAGPFDGLDTYWDPVDGWGVRSSRPAGWQQQWDNAPAVAAVVQGALTHAAMLAEDRALLGDPADNVDVPPARPRWRDIARRHVVYAARRARAWVPRVHARDDIYADAPVTVTGASWLPAPPPDVDFWGYYGDGPSPVSPIVELLGHLAAFRRSIRIPLRLTVEVTPKPRRPLLGFYPDALGGEIVLGPVRVEVDW